MLIARLRIIPMRTSVSTQSSGSVENPAPISSWRHYTSISRCPPIAAPSSISSGKTSLNIAKIPGTNNPPLLASSRREIEWQTLNSRQ